MMEKSLFEQMGGTYTQVGDYFLPDLKLPEDENKSIGVWGQRHLWYIRRYKRLLYANLLTSGKLNSYLANIDRQAEDMFFLLIKQMAEHEKITEQLKAENQLEWVQMMNNIRSRATEIVLNDMIYL